MKRHIRIRHSASALNVRILLLDDLAPRSAQALWLIAERGGPFEAMHAIWTGPEISCPIPEAQLPEVCRMGALEIENATSYPDEGDVALLHVPAGTWKGQPDFGFLDIGLFYGRGARLLMPMGWVMAPIAGRVVEEDMDGLRTACRAIRRGGVCELDFSREA
jgi:hypothetical protein